MRTPLIIIEYGTGFQHSLAELIWIREKKKQINKTTITNRRYVLVHQVYPRSAEIIPPGYEKARPVQGKALRQPTYGRSLLVICIHVYIIVATWGGKAQADLIHASSDSWSQLKIGQHTIL